MIDQDCVVKVTARARERLTEINDEMRQLRACYGDEAVADHASSLAICLGTLMKMGGQVMVDGDGLGLSNDYIYIGMVCHRESPRATLARTRMAETADDLDDEQLDQMFPVRCGTWSLNS